MLGKCLIVSNVIVWTFQLKVVYQALTSFSEGDYLSCICDTHFLMDLVCQLIKFHDSRLTNSHIAKYRLSGYFTSQTLQL